jgi:hypothetical protein
VKVDIHNGRILNSSINQDGFILISHYYDGQILGKYYPECCKMVQSITGLKEIFAFDHNIGSFAKKSWINENSNHKSEVLFFIFIVVS